MVVETLQSIETLHFRNWLAALKEKVPVPEAKLSLPSLVPNKLGVEVYIRIVS
jgi:hypothetical protein